MLEAELWIQSAVYKLFPGWMQRWMNDPLDQYKKSLETLRKYGGEEAFDPSKHRFTKDKEGNYTREDGPTQQWIRDEIGYKKGGYTGALGGIVHPKEFVFNSDAVNQWGVNLLSSMNEGRIPLESLVANKESQLGKTPRRTVISYEELPIIRQSKSRGNVRNNEGSSPVTSVPTYSSINPFDKDIAKGPLHYGFAEFI